VGEVIEGSFISSLPVPPEKILRAVNKWHEEDPFSRVLVIACTVDNPSKALFWMSDPDGGTALWDMEKLRTSLMKVAFED
jgi:hypothetical protein